MGDGPVESIGARPSMQPSPTTTATVTTPPVAPTPERLTSSTPTTYPIPRRVTIPAIDVNAAVVPVGLDRNDALAIPADIAKVGWYELGVPPGAPRGSAVLVAHRDGRAQGRGVFYDLGRLDLGDAVRIRTDAGDTLTYEVVARESIRKSGVPYEEIFTVDGPARLTLISCGGVYDPDRGGYQDNIVITALPRADEA